MDRWSSCLPAVQVLVLHLSPYVIRVAADLPLLHEVSRRELLAWLALGGPGVGQYALLRA
jgi:hypothetical protein